MRSATRTVLTVATFLIASLCLSISWAGTLHLVLVADNGTGDDGFDRYINRDVVNIMVLAANAASGAGLNFSATAHFPEELSTPNAFRLSTRKGKRIRKAQHWALRNLKTPFDDVQFTRHKSIQRTDVRRSLQGLKVGADDVVWFHYTGHGFRWSDKKNKWPALFIGPMLEDAMEFEEALKYVKATPARLKIAIADSCNSLVDQEMPDSQKHSGARGAAARAKGFRALFEKGEGYLFMAGASPGEYGWSVDPQGGVFTYKIAHRIMIEVEKGGSASWTKMARKFKKPIYDFGIKQTPIADFRFGKGAARFAEEKKSGPKGKYSRLKLSPQVSRQMIQQVKLRKLRPLNAKSKRKSKGNAMKRAKTPRVKTSQPKKRTTLRNCLRHCSRKYGKKKERLKRCRRACSAKAKRKRR